MASKFMKIRKIVLPTVTVFIIASQLMGCSCASQDEMLETLNKSKEIEIEVAELGFKEQGEETELTWTRLDQLVSYSSFRESMDSVLGIKSLNSTKYGIAYVGLDGNQSGNNTLYNAFMNEAFVKGYWNNEEVQSKVNALAISLYADVEDGSKDSIYASINAYWNLLSDNTDYYFNGGASLTRGEAMALVARAINEVTEDGKPVADSEFTKAVGVSEYTNYANYVAGSSYLSTTDKSLNNQTFNGTMTRGEYIYLITTIILGDSEVSSGAEEVSLSDCKDGGDIAKKQKFSGDYADSYELNYAIQHADSGAPTKLYKAMVYAKSNGIIGEETRWDEAVTKTEAIELLVNTLNAYTTKNGFKVNSLGETEGEKMRETAKATYQSIANQLTTDENTYVSEYIVLIDQGNSQEDTERSLLEKYKKTEQESEQQSYETEHKPKPTKPSDQVHFNNMEEGYVEIGGKRLWVDSNGYIFHEDKTTPFTMDEIDEVIGDSGTITVSKPSGTSGEAGTKESEGGLSEEQSRRQAEEESRIQAVQDEIDEAIKKGSEEVGSGDEMTSDANWEFLN